MIKKILTLIFLWLALLTNISSLAQLKESNNILFNRITAKDGLNANSISYIFQDSRNFLWIGTDRGLVRYDGQFFKHYNQISEGGLTNRIVTCINEDAAGNIWIGTENGLNKLNPFTNKITQYQQGEGEGKIPYKWCNYLFVDKKKQLWLTTEKGIAMYNVNQNNFVNYPITVVGDDEKINKFINQVVEDSIGNFWLSTSFGLKFFNRTTKKYTSYHKEEKKLETEKENILYGTHVDSKGTIWAIAFGGLILRYNKTINKVETVFDVNNKNIRFFSLTSFNKDGKIYLLLATSNGLWQIDTEDFQKPVEKVLEPNSLSKIFIDKQQNIWVASNTGLYRKTASSNFLKWNNITENENSFVFHIIPFLNNNNQFFLTTTSNWYKYDNSNSVIAKYTLPTDKRELLTKINRYVVDENGYWFTSINGFGYYNVKENNLTDLTQLILNKSNQFNTGFIEEPIKNQLWITIRRSGILLYNKATKKDTLLFGDKQKPNNVFGIDIYDFKLSPDGFVWFTTGEKIYKINPTTFQYKIFSIGKNQPSVYRLLFTKNGRVLVNSESNIYQLKNEQLKLIYPQNGSLNFSLSRLIEDEKNKVWAITDNGLYKTDSNFSYWKNMNSIQGLEDEMPGYEINLSIPDVVMLTSKGRIGLLNYKMLEQVKPPGQALISKIRLGNKEFFFPETSHINYCGYKDAIEVELAAPDFNNEKGNTIFYNLEGWDTEWKKLIASNIVRYEQLPAGKYVFSTKVINADGKESIITSTQFKIVPPFYKTWWFILLLISAIGFVVYMFYQYKLKKAVELEKIRTKIATDLHDDIGATLSSISMYSDALSKQVKESMPHLEPVLNKMGENSREMVAGISDIVWAVNPENDTGEKLLQRMETYATDLCAVKNIQLHFLIDKKIKEVLLLPEKRKNIYLIFKEAINNAVKYAEAKNIWVNIKKDSSLVVTIKDDGIGFNYDTVKKGNGLKNLKLRANEINGFIEVKSNNGEGTLITLTCSF
jgi:ligand-binding sensor domain-containing protein